MRKIMVMLLFTGVIFTVNAQENKRVKYANERDNWVSGGLTVPARYLGISIGAQYERMLGSKISIGADFSYTFYSSSNDLSMDAFFRYYPWGKTFYLGTGLGFDCIDLRKSSFYYFTAGLCPEIGWKIERGVAGGFFLQPGIKFPDVIYLGGGVAFGFSPCIYIGMGYAF